jgi:hypothetical protein
VTCGERFAEGLATGRELDKASEAARSALAAESGEIGKSLYWQAAEAAVHVVARRFDDGDHPSVAHASFGAANAWAMSQRLSPQGRSKPNIDKGRKQRHAVHAKWLRDIFGNPFAPLAAREFPVNVVFIAQSCYAAFPEVSTDFRHLADLLDEVGEDAAAAHCREKLHVKGCHVLDWILGKS